MWPLTLSSDLNTGQTCVSRHLRVTAVFALQGVTLTDLQEAEKTMKTENKGKEKTKEEEEKEAKQKKAEEGVRKVEFTPNICICSALGEINSQKCKV